MEFKAKVRKEGKEGRLIAIPIGVVRELQQGGWERTWIELTVGEHTWIGKVRNGGAVSTIISIPRRCGGGELAIGQTITGSVEDPTPRRCKPGPLFPPSGGLDWSAVLPDEQFTEEDGDDLVIHTKYAAPFRVKRIQTLEAFWLLGFYQAEGSKSDNANEWTLAQKNADLLAKTRDQLELCSIDRSRLYLEIIYGETQTPEEACAPYESLDVEIRHARMRSKKSFGGTEAAVYHLRDSKCLMRMYRSALREIILGNGIDAMSVEEAKQFTIGYLDGDGCLVCSVRSAGVDILVRIAGVDAERPAIVRSLKKGFGWEQKLTKVHDHGAANGGILLSLTVNEALDLVLTDVFETSFSRVRLLQGIEQRLVNLSVLYEAFERRWFTLAQAAALLGKPPGVVSLMKQWGLTERRGDAWCLTRQVEDVMRKAKEAEPELALFRAKCAGLELERKPKSTPNPLFAKPE